MLHRNLRSQTCHTCNMCLSIFKLLSIVHFLYLETTIKKIKNKEQTKTICEIEPNLGHRLMKPLNTINWLVSQTGTYLSWVLKIQIFLSGKLLVIFYQITINQMNLNA